MSYSKEYYEMYPVGLELLYKGFPATIIKREDRPNSYKGAMLMKFDEPHWFCHNADGFFTEQVGRWIECSDFSAGRIKFCTQVIGIEDLI